MGSHLLRNNMGFTSIYEQSGLTPKQINELKTQVAHQQIRTAIDSLKEVYADEHKVSIEEINTRVAIALSTTPKFVVKPFALPEADVCYVL
jgi:chromosome segregation and condensation protein ScpB